MRTFRNIAWGFVAFVAVAVIAGQFIMYGQGDTTEISMRYGLLYVVTGCGIRDILKMIRIGEFNLPLVVAVLLELLAGIAVFLRLQKMKNKTPDGISL